MAENKTAMRYDFADYYDLGTADTPSFELMGTGFTTLDENPNAQTEQKVYINDKAASTNVKSYQTQFPFSADAIVSEAVVADIYDIATRQKTGGDVVRGYIRVELWRAGQTVGTFTARKFNVAVQVDSIAGAGGEVVVLGGNLNAMGDAVDGEFDPTTKTFTAISA